MNEKFVKEAVADFLAKGGKIEVLPEEVVVTPKNLRVGFGHSHTGAINAYSYDSTVYATEKTVVSQGE